MNATGSNSSAGAAPISPSAELPAALRTKIDAFERRLRRVETAVTVGFAIAAVAALFLLIFLADRAWDTPVALRVAAAAAGAGAIAAAAGAWLRRWWWRRPDARRLARLIQRRLPAIGDRLLGAVELASDHAAAGPPVSAALRRAAIDQVARESERLDFRAAAPARPGRRAAAAALALSALAATVLWRYPEAGWNALRRWLRPTAPIERFTFVRLEEFPSELVVPRGEPFEIACATRSVGGWQPRKAVCRVGRNRWTREIGADGRAVFRIPGQSRPATLSLRIGDVARDARIRPEYRPALLALNAHVRPPPWLGRPDETAAVEAGWLRVPEDAEIRLEGRVSRELTSASIRGAPAVDIETEGAAFRTPWFLATRRTEGTPPPLPETVVLAWRDIHGFEPADAVRLRTTILPDAPPTVRCEGLGGSVAMLEDETLRIDVVAGDDYGVQRIWVEWQRVAEDGTAAAATTTARPLADGAPDRTELRAEHVVSPEAMRWPPDSAFDLWAAAIDYRPNREPSLSSVYRIYVISRTRHAQLLEEQARSAQARLEELRREEETRLERTREIAEMADEAAIAEAAADRLRDTESGERRDAAQADRLAEEFAALAREALRNRDIEESTVFDWAKMAERLERLASEPMAAAAERLRRAQAAASASSRKAEAAEAAERQREALREMSQMIRESAETADQLASRSFVNRLREAAERQREVAAQVQAGLPARAGRRFAELPAPDRAELTRLADLQARYRRAAQDIRDDLAGFFARSGGAIYGEVAREMAEPDVLDDMAEIRRRVGENLSFMAAEGATELATRFDGWADRLDPSAAGAGGGAGGGGQGAKLPVEVLLGLLRARARQETLREATRELDRQRAERGDYPAAAERLASRQDEIERDLSALNERAGGGRVRQFMEAIEREMIVSAATLREPQTDAAAIAIQTGIIEAIAQALESGGQGGEGGESAPSAEAMAALTRLMRALGQRGGGSLAGGTTSRGNAAPTGPGQGTAAARRAVERAADGGTLPMPEEFREMLQGYFDGLERQP